MTSSDPRAVAARLAARAQIRDIRLLATTAVLISAPIDTAGLSYNLNINPSAEWTEGEPNLVVKCEYTVQLLQKPNVDRDGIGAAESHDAEPISQTAENAENQGTNLAEIAFTLAGLFDVSLREDDKPFTTDELAAYAQTTGNFALYPFAREYVRDVTGRLGIPPLVLGVAIQPIPKPEIGADDRAEPAAPALPSTTS